MVICTRSGVHFPLEEELTVCRGVGKIELVVAGARPYLPPTLLVILAPLMGRNRWDGFCFLVCITFTGLAKPHTVRKGEGAFQPGCLPGSACKADDRTFI